jgi:CDGSH-type Zn-finger protein
MTDRNAGGGATGQDGAVVSVYEDGPLIVRGDFAITGQDGQPIPTGRRTVALCRCGGSAIKPFCDGTHTRTGFRAPGGAQGRRAAAQNRVGSGGAQSAATRAGDPAAELAGDAEQSAGSGGAEGLGRRQQ